MESSGGIQTQGVYRLVGVQSKVDLLIKQLMSHDTIEWEELDIRTMTGAIKGIMRNFEEPVLTFKHHYEFLGNFHNLLV